MARFLMSFYTMRLLFSQRIMPNEQLKAAMCNTTLIIEKNICHSRCVTENKNGDVIRKSRIQVHDSSTHFKYIKKDNFTLN